MDRPTILLTVALALVATSSGAIIWTQHNRIEALKASNLDADHDRAALRRRLAAVDTPMPAARARKTDVEREQEETARGPDRPQGPGAGEDGNFETRRNRDIAMLAEMLADPELSALMLTQQKAGLDSRYAALFRQLGLDPKETEALKNLLAERQLARMEAGVMVRTEGLDRNDRTGMRELILDADNDVEAKLRGLLGPDNFNTLKTYEQSAGERMRVDRFALRLSYSAAPLQTYQSDALVQLLASVSQPRSPGRNATAQETASYTQARQAYETEVLSRAQSVLSPVQVEALKQYQQEQADQARLSSLLPGRMREGLEGRGRPGG